MIPTLRMAEVDTTIQMTPKTRGANIITTQRTETDKQIWSGLFHFRVNPDCDIDYLRGAVGGFVNAIAVAHTSDEFVAKVSSALEDRKLSSNTAEQLENISSGYVQRSLSDEWMSLCRDALNSGEVSFTTFDLYDEED